MDFEKLYHTYYQPLFRFCYRMVYDAEEAQDLVQDAFIRLHDRLAFNESIDNVQAWLYRVAGRLCLNHLHKKKRRFGFLQILQADASAMQNEESVINHTEIEIVRRAMQKLKEKERLLISLYYDDLSYKEIACIMEIKNGNVGRMLARAIEKLADMLKETHEISMPSR